MRQTQISAIVVAALVLTGTVAAAFQEEFLTPTLGESPAPLHDVGFTVCAPSWPGDPGFVQPVPPWPGDPGFVIILPAATPDTADVLPGIQPSC